MERDLVALVYQEEFELYGQWHSRSFFGYMIPRLDESDGDFF